MIGLSGRVATARILYAPALDVGFVRVYNAANGTEHPEDLPIDCIGVLHGLPNITTARLEREIAPENPKLALLTLVLAHDVPRATRTVEPWLHHSNEAISSLAADLTSWLSDLEA